MAWPAYPDMMKRCSSAPEHARPPVRPPTVSSASPDEQHSSAVKLSAMGVEHGAMSHGGALWIPLSVSGR